MAPTPGAVPPVLPPSVEEAYRRKCVQLKQRMNEVEEANDASRIRLTRLQRAIEKQRLERAFLLEQLAKRTSTNVEDSEGSPSPPPTPKEKPLRTKRGHRKPSFLAEIDGRAGGSIIPQGPNTMSPSSDAFSHTHPEANPLPSDRPAVQPTFYNNGPIGPQGTPGNQISDYVPYSAPARPTYIPGHLPGGASPPVTTFPSGVRPKNSFELYSIRRNLELLAENKDTYPDGITYEREIASGWTNLTTEGRTHYEHEFDALKRRWDAEKEAARETPSPAEPRDEDVEMGDDGDSHSDGDGGGFTAVNGSGAPPPTDNI